MRDIKILVCCHKPCNYPDNKLFLPIQVGKSCSIYDLKMQSDSEINNLECDNISELNSVYCEMTAMYWAWKNIKKIYPSIEYIGLCHYRRYFDFRNRIFSNLPLLILEKAKVLISTLFEQRIRARIFDPRMSINSLDCREFKESNIKLKEIIYKYDIIATKPIRFLNCDVKLFFSVIGRAYIEILEEIIESSYPEYKDEFKIVMNGSKLSAANMIILRIGFLDEYCKFIFGVLMKHIERTKETGICIDPLEEGIYKRVSGYLSEILTYVYILKKEKESKVAYVGKFFLNTSDSK